MLETTVTFILAGGRGERLQPLTRDRAKPAVPFGDRRIIDFTLSNCIQSGLTHPFVLIQQHAESLHQHVRCWSLSQTVATPSQKAQPTCVPSRRTSPYRGTADALFQNATLMKDATEVVVLSADHIYELDYRQMIQYHRDREAAATIASIVCPKQYASQFGIMAVNADWRVVDFEEKPANPKTVPGRPGHVLANMGVYIFDARILVQALSEDARAESSNHDIGRNVLPKLALTERVYAFNFVDHKTGEPGYWRDVGTLDSYYAAVMECYGNGGSVISERALIHRTADIVESIVMPGARVGPGARVRRAILDENVVVGAGACVGYGSNAQAYPFTVTSTGITVVPAGTRVMSDPYREPSFNVLELAQG